MTLLSATKRGGFVLAISVALLLAPWQGRAQAMEEAGKNSGSEPFSEQPFLEWLETLRKEARGKGISDATLDAALRDIAPDMRVIELDRRQPEFIQTFWTYLNQRVNDERIRRGQALLAKHRDLLDKIHAEYGVSPRYLVAFWGLETNFGDNLGSFRVIDALATLAYDQRRARFFRMQLLDALQIIEEGHISPDAMTGSWAGAMGHMQFIPSTFIGHAVDYTGDGRKDIWSSLPDSFSSAANFLSNLGWRPVETWGREVRLPPDFDLMLATMSSKKSLAEWSALGVRRTDGLALSEMDMEGSIVLPQGHKGPAFLVCDNFRVIMRWNRSINYAISVGHLADRIAGLPQIASGRDAAHEPLSRGEIEELQQLLNRFGFDAGPADGLPGPRTQAAIRAFQKEQSLPPDGYPEPALLKRLRAMATKLS
ncbi:MAG: lytic murein transglycosylase [Deltaproteobacteria bacterium HGW-Deltaproteobacteria-15]|jgi:membrane-bound lytic murein transglycosylase B|nr:MAG: lytic murein transglycosylase [Deltaproteobacteria bacterium HGW-Deltaproteobacteria-15]